MKDFDKVILKYDNKQKMYSAVLSNKALFSLFKRAWLAERNYISLDNVNINL